MIKHPKVTIGITCYNAAGSVERAVNSALVQDWQNLEIIIVDDVSTDTSRDKIQKLGEYDKRIEIIYHEKNLGPAAARNSIVNAASGEYIVFFDDDDESSPERVRVQIETIKEYKQQHSTSKIACYASGIRKYNNGYVLNLNAIGSESGREPKGEAIVNYLLLYEKLNNYFYGHGTPSCSLAIETTVLKEVGGFDENLRRVEDADFAIRLGLEGGHFIGCSENLFTQYATSAVDKTPEKNLQAEIAMVKKYEIFLKKKGCFYYALHWPQLRYNHFSKNYGRFFKELLLLFIRYPIRTSVHFNQTAPKRFVHELKMKLLNGHLFK